MATRDSAALAIIDCAMFEIILGLYAKVGME